MSSYHFVLLWSCYTSTCCSIKSLNVWCCIWNLRIQLQELYVCSSSSFCSWDGETCLVGLYYNFSWQRQKKHHVHAAAFCPTTCGGWGDRMDSNDGGCVQSWMTGWLAGELNAQELLLLLTAKILGNSGIFQFAFKVHIPT